MMKQALEARGFKVSVLDVPTGGNADFGKQMLSQMGIKEFRESYDAVILAVSVSGASGSNERRIHWRISMGPEIPWYVPEKPSIMVSFTNPFHLIDVPAIPTVINAYTRSQEVADIVVEKIMGEKPFSGISPVDAFCGAWDTRI
jgi:beta-N-acetylhexosaminidase